MPLTNTIECRGDNGVLVQVDEFTEYLPTALKDGFRGRSRVNYKVRGGPAVERIDARTLRGKRNGEMYIFAQ
ncbi:MAG: hypothetical protein JKY94_07815 [Rhodobacteraceae bacterium]|nr:hypothetical protein [Paracoccaceae bacterium]